MVALSSTEAEYITVAWSAQQAVWLTEFMNEVFLPQPTPITIYSDNLGSIACTKRTKGHQLSKHMDIKYHFNCDLVESCCLEVKPNQTQDNIVDIMTKSLSKSLHNTFMHILGLDYMRNRACQGE
jgi:hypothetical protein